MLFTNATTVMIIIAINSKILMMQICTADHKRIFPSHVLRVSAGLEMSNSQVDCPVTWQDSGADT